MELVPDTNIYLNLIKGLDDKQVNLLTVKIRKACQAQGHTIMFPIHAAMELISHLNDDTEPSKTECAAALKLLVNVSIQESANKGTIIFVPPLDSVLANYFFGKEETYTKLYANVIDQALKMVGNLPFNKDEDKTKNIDSIKNQLNFEKKGIRDNYEDYLKSLNNGEADWTYFKERKEERKAFFNKIKMGGLSFLVAQGFVNRAHTIAEKPPEKGPAYFEQVLKFMRDFAPALLMNEMLLKKIGLGVEAIQDSKDPRWNTVIDISLIIGSLHNPDNAERKFVTEEKSITKAYHDCNIPDKIMNLAEFKLLLCI